MFKEIIESIKQLTRAQEPIDPSIFGDPVAQITPWTPAKRGGANFRTHKLVEVSPNRMEFRISAGATIFFMLFLVVGLVIIVGVCPAMVVKGKVEHPQALFIPAIVGLVFAIAGGAMLYFGSRPIVFDRVTGYFYKGRTGPDQVIQNQTIKDLTPLDEIHALQLISELCHGKNSSYYSYELNLVLNDGRRINAVDHGNHKKIRDQAWRLSDFLGKPVWDAT